MSDPLAQRIERLARRVRTRGVRVGRPRGEAELAAFERAHGVALPGAYRGFLLAVGDGCDAGPPHYGLCRLGHVPSDYHRSPSEVLARLAEPFGETEPWTWEDEEDDDPERRDGVERGALVLGTDGCGLYYLLVVTGAARGQIWLSSDVGVAPVEDVEDFVEWFEAWLTTR